MPLRRGLALALLLLLLLLLECLWGLLSAEELWGCSRDLGRPGEAREASPLPLLLPLLLLLLLLLPLPLPLPLLLLLLLLLPSARAAWRSSAAADGLSAALSWHSSSSWKRLWGSF